MVGKVVSKARRTRRETRKEFAFTKDMMLALSDGRAPILQEYANHAWSIYNATKMPTTKDEPWRRTDIKRLQSDKFELPEKDAYKELAPVPGHLLEPLVGEKHGGQITMMPGYIDVDLDPDLEEKGVIFTDIATAGKEHADKLGKILGKVVRPEEGKFASLIGGFADQGVFIYVPAGVHIAEPLHSVFWAAGVNLAHLSHILVYVEDGASLTYVHEYASPSESGGQTLVGSLVEIYVGQNSNLRFVELQSLGDNVWNFTHERAKVEKDGNLDWIFGAIGSKLTKNFSDLDLIGEGANGRMSGFYFTDGKQHLDHDTQQNHLAQNTTSDLLFKGALKEKSRSVWQGMIYVAEGAQQTDGYQANRNLVLSDSARADSIPGLEILADDVRCTHGATVGKIDPDLVFYLRSRGISPEEAERLVVEGFFDPIMQRIPFEGVRERFQIAIKNKMA